ncbi:MAG TPA: hypothetical protein VFE14_18440, partial [Micromonosporaceae bacterium]|nr:hypothetical protein [Micromonosporaceae bacterium]
LRVWYGSANTWRVAVFGPTGERDIYQTPAGIHVWDFERNAVNETAGDLPIRLPSGADLLPPTMARRLLGAARDAPMVGIASRRIAGISAAGLRMTPADPDTTVGSVSIWADPRTGLPLQVEVTARGADTPVISTRFIELAQTAPDPGLLAPVIPDQAGFSVTSGQRVLDALGTLSPVPLPPVVANRSRTPGVSTVVGVGSYGDGLSTFVVVSLRGRNGARTFEKIRDSGAIPLAMAGGQAYQAAIPLLSMLVVRADGPRGRIYLLAGAVTPELLAQAGAELLAPR